VLDVANSSANELSAATTKKVAPKSVSGRVVIDSHWIALALDGELDICAGRASNPISLHRQDFLWPLTFELFHIIEQTIGVISDLEIPLI